mgnify:CR=1 FL=1
MQIADIFEETANQEKEHAKRLFKFLEGGEVEITAAFPAGAIGSTLENLKAAAAGENYEHTIMYPEFAATARREGFDNIANTVKTLDERLSDLEKWRVEVEERWKAEVEEAKEEEKEERRIRREYIYNLKAVIISAVVGAITGGAITLVTSIFIR